MKRGTNIPEWAYRHVLFMLIDYSIRSFEMLERPLTTAEKAEVLYIFYRVGSRMDVKALPNTLEQWEGMRQAQLHQDLQHSHFTDDLFKQYRKHLRPVSYRILLAAQTLIIPQRVRELLGFARSSFLRFFMLLYKFSRLIRVDWLLKELLLPSRYSKEIKALDG